MVSASTLVKISRPGLWLVFIWLYLWPTGGSWTSLHSPSFWIGLLFITFPLNLLVYGMNDLVDEDVDIPNPRKGNFIYGAKTNAKEREGLFSIILGCNIIPLIGLGILTSEWLYLFLWLISALFVNFVYNNKPFQLSRKCPYELPTMIAGHFMIPLLACKLNNLPIPSISSWIFHALLLSRSHLWLEYADIACDKKEGKRTIAVVLGFKKALYLVLALTFIESLVGFFMLESCMLGFFSFFGMVVFYLSASDNGVKEEKLNVSISQSLVGLVLMCYLWTNRVLV